MATPQQFATLLETQQQLQQQLMELLSSQQDCGKTLQSTTRLNPSIDSISSSISDFTYDAENGLTFESWFKRYEDVFKIDAASLPDDAQVRLLLRKLPAALHDKYTKYVLPKNPRDFTFKETIDILTKIFAPRASLFSVRYPCLRVTKSPTDDIIAYTGLVNQHCERFRLKELSEEQFRRLIFVQGLRSPCDSDFRVRLLQMIDRDPQLNIHDLAEEYQRLKSLKHDTTLVEDVTTVTGAAEARAAKVSVSRRSQRSWLERKSPTTKGKPSSPCWFCGEWHFARYCPFQKHMCAKCGVKGHKDGFCRPKKVRNDTFAQSAQTHRERARSSGVFSTSAVSLNLRKYVTPLINGYPVRLQLDSGSDCTLITQKTWEAMGRPELLDTTLEMVDASNNVMQLAGYFKCQMSLNNRCGRGRCFLTTQSRLNLLGLDWIDQLQLWNMSSCGSALHENLGSEQKSEQQPMDIRSLYPTVCNAELGHCTRFKASLRLRPDAQPIFKRKRPVPYAALALVEQELERLEQLGIISKVDYSDWAAPIVAVKKANGTVRLCADFSTGLKDALEDHQYPLPAAVGL